jgi:membrane protease YdiL (CAAX protease family)
VAATRQDDDQRIRWGLGDAVLATVLGIVLATVALSIVFSATGIEASDELDLWAGALLQLPLWLGLAGVPWLAARFKGSGSIVRDFGFRTAKVDVPIGLAVGLLSQGALALVVPPLYRLVGVDADKIGDTAEALSDRAAGPFDVFCLFLMVVIGAAVVEELCYRGLWQRSFERRFGPTAAVVLSGLVFGLVHFQPYDFVPLTMFGLVLAWLAARYGRLGPAIWAHMAFNLTALVNLLVN